MNHTSPFRVCTNVTVLSNDDIDSSIRMPLENEMVRSINGLIRLGKSIAEGGEGKIFETDRPGKTAKIYKVGCRSELRREKVNMLAGRHLSYPGICFPEEVLYDRDGNFIGFLMDRAEGESLAVTVMNPVLLRKKFPDWKDADLARLCVTILKKVQYLHSMGIIMGDVNQGNILVKSPETVYFVDTDSYQVEGLPCPVGTAEFTAPELLKKGVVDYSKILRTRDQDYYAVSVLLFEILIHGKYPYAVVRNDDTNGQEGRIFPYRRNGMKSELVPPGKWNTYWSEMPGNIRKAFCSTFISGEKHNAPGKRYSEQKWLRLIGSYQKRLRRAESESSWGFMFLCRTAFNIGTGIFLGAHIWYFLRMTPAAEYFLSGFAA